MASLFEIGKSGVQAYRQALSVTGQNIANVNTDGYNMLANEVWPILKNVFARYKLDLAKKKSNKNIKTA